MIHNFNIFKKFRRSLDLLYIHFAPIRVTKFNYKDSGIKKLLDLRICFIKQETYSDLYTDPTLSGLDLLLSTIHRSGPIGLFNAKLFDFKILKSNNNYNECKVWEFIKEDMNGDSFDEILKNSSKIFTKLNGDTVNKKPQNFYSISQEKIDFSLYDIVISVNFPFTRDFILKYPQILWCYMPQEPSLRHYKWSKKSPLYNYNIFLNQQFTIRFKKRKSHEINFPYNFMHSSSFSNLLGLNNLNSNYNRNGIFIENHSLKSLTPIQLEKFSSIFSITFPCEELFEQVLLKMYKAKYFYSLRKNNFKLWGNSMIDAIASGLLSFGNPDEYVNLDLFTPFTIIYNTEEFLDKIIFLEKNTRIYYKEIQLQRQLLDKYCFYKPVLAISNSFYNLKTANISSKRNALE